MWNGLHLQQKVGSGHIDVVALVGIGGHLNVVSVPTDCLLRIFGRVVDATSKQPRA